MAGDDPAPRPDDQARGRDDPARGRDDPARDREDPRGFPGPAALGEERPEGRGRQAFEGPDGERPEGRGRQAFEGPDGERPEGAGRQAREGPEGERGPFGTPAGDPAPPGTPAGDPSPPGTQAGGPAAPDPKKAKKKRRLIIAGAGLALAAILAVFSFLTGGGPEPLAPPPGPDPEALYAQRIDELHPWVEGSEYPSPPRPAFLAEMRLAGGRAGTLATGVEDFIRGDYQKALTGFETAGESLPPSAGLSSLEASTHLRLLNYGRAKELYLSALDLRSASRDPAAPASLADAADRLGLALCLFHEPDAEGALREASIAWNIRKEGLGPTSAGTLAALNVMATSLIALSRTAVAGDMLLEAVSLALDSGVKADDPSLLDSLSILALAFEAQGRLDELSALFGPRGETPGEPDPTAAAEAAPEAAEPEPIAPPPPPLPRQPLDLPAARSLLIELTSVHADSVVLPALALGIHDEMTSEASPPCSGPFSSENFAELLGLCLLVADGYGRQGQEGEMARILESFSALTPPPAAAAGTGPNRYRAEGLLASLRTKAGDLPGAEAAWRRAAAEAENRADSPDPGIQADDILLARLRLADNLLAQGRPTIEAELEVMHGLAKAEPMVGRNGLESRPVGALTFLRLSQILKSMGRNREAKEQARRVDKAIKAGAAAHPEAANWYEGLAKLAESVAKASTKDVDRHDLSALYRLALPADRPPSGPASPEVMRLELSALKLLGRAGDFRPMIELAMRTALERDGPTSPSHRRYQSLWLKFLEESGDLAGLLAALDDLAADPGLPPGRESLAIKTSALRYKARVLLDRDRVPEAAQALGEARSLLVNEPDFAQRLMEIESELQRLGASPGIEAQTTQVPAPAAPAPAAPPPDAGSQ